MDNFTAQDATSALNMLSEVVLQRDEEFSNFNLTRYRTSSDDETDSPCPYFDQFFEQDENESISDMCNFTATEF